MSETSENRGQMTWESLQQISDNDLISQLLDGNHDALAVIVDRYQRLVFSIALRIVKDEGEAEDVVQIVFLDVFRNVGKFDPARGTLKVWLLQYAYTRSINRRYHLEQHKFYSRLELDEIDPFDCSTGFRRNDGWSTGETARLVRETLGMLNPRQRLAIELVYFKGLKFAEAAQKAGESLPALRHHYYRGMMKLRELITEHSSPADQKRGTESESVRVKIGGLPRPVFGGGES